MSTKEFIDLLPNRQIRLPLSWLITGLLVVVSLSVAYGGFKAGYQNQAKEIGDAKTEIQSLRKDVNSLEEKIVQLTTSLGDLKDSIDHQHRGRP